MAKRIRVGVIGTGWWATATHIPALLADPDVEIAGFCDARPERLRAAAAAYGVERTYTDHRVLLERERPDALVVATTHATHFGVARDCIDAGAQVLVEKPMTLTAADARALVERAAAAGIALIVGYPWNYSEHAREVRRRIAGGSLGAVQLVQSVLNAYNADLIGGRDRSDQPNGYPVHGPGSVYSRKEDSGGGHGHLQMTHAVGLLCFVTGLRIATVQARMSNQGLPLDLVDSMVVEFEGGALGSVSGTSNGFLSASTLTVGCASGGVEMDIYRGTTLLRYVGGEPETLPPADGTDLKYAPVRNLLAVARGAESPGSPGEIGWRAVELLDAAYRSAADGGRAIAVEELY